MSNSRKTLLITSVCLGAILGGSFAYASGTGKHSHDHSATTELMGENAPTLAMKITEDRMSGWNVEIQTTNFQYAPKAAGLPHRDGEGHAHLYINGEKIGRVYGRWLHIGKLDSGMNEISITLNGNDHSQLSANGKDLKVIEIVHAH